MLAIMAMGGRSERGVEPRAHALGRSVLRVAWLAALGLCAAGCLVAPFGTPPMTVSAAPGIALGRPLPTQAAPEQPKGRVLIDGRAAIEPLGLVEGLQDRPFDVSVGYLVELFPPGELIRYTHHGAFLGFTQYPWMSVAPEDSGGVRLLVRVMPELLVTEDEGRLGGGMTFNLGIETFGFVQTDFAGMSSDGGYAGVAAGEGGVGLELGAGVRGIDEMRYWSLHLGLTLRLPATGGVAAVPIWTLADALD
jgi:hypothetical protein